MPFSASPRSGGPDLPSPPRGQLCPGHQGPESAPRAAQRKGQADSQQLLSFKFLLGVAATSPALRRPQDDSQRQGQAGANAQD